MIVAAGTFAYPNLSEFPRRILHSKDVKYSHEFKDKRVLIGSSYSAKDLALQALKYGASQIIIR